MDKQLFEKAEHLQDDIKFLKGCVMFLRQEGICIPEDDSPYSPETGDFLSRLNKHLAAEAQRNIQDKIIILEDEFNKL